jgi:hypothetical protein
LLGKTRNKLNVGKKYHSGKISNGVANGFAGSPNPDGSNTESQLHMQTFRKLRLGRCKVNHLATLVHRKLCPIPFANFALNLGSDKSGFNN